MPLKSPKKIKLTNSFCDPQLTDVLNLLNNAINFTEREKPHIACELFRDSAPSQTINASFERGYITMERKEMARL